MNEYKMVSAQSSTIHKVALSRGARYCVYAIVASILFLSQIAFNIGEFPATPALFLYLFMFAYLVASGRVVLNLVSIMIFALFILVAIIGIATASAEISLNSLFLVLVLHLPYVIRYKTSIEVHLLRAYFFKVFISFSVVLAVIAIVQFVLVNLAGLHFLSNVANIIPEQIHNAGQYTYTREYAGTIKANGYFLRESSTLSIMMAFAIIMEYLALRRIWVLGVLLVGLLLSFSGSGVLVIASAVLLPTTRRSAVALLLLVVTGWFLWLGANIPGVNIWIDRLSEFQTVGTSGYTRFVAPAEMVSDGFSHGKVSVYFGNGAGSYLRALHILHPKDQISDPSWAKLLYEYGVLGCFLLTSLVAFRLYTSRLPMAFCNAFLYAWMFTGASFVAPEFVFLLWMISILGSDRRLPRWAWRGMLRVRPRNKTGTLAGVTNREMLSS